MLDDRFESLTSVFLESLLCWCCLSPVRRCLSRSRSRSRSVEVFFWLFVFEEEDFSEDCDVDVLTPLSLDVVTFSVMLVADATEGGSMFSVVADRRGVTDGREAEVPMGVNAGGVINGDADSGVGCVGTTVG